MIQRHFNRTPTLRTPTEQFTLGLVLIVFFLLLVALLASMSNANLSAQANEAVNTTTPMAQMPDQLTTVIHKDVNSSQATILSETNSSLHAIALITVTEPSTPVVTPTITATSTPTVTATPTVRRSFLPLAQKEPLPTATPTPTSTATETPTPTPTAVSTPTPFGTLVPPDGIWDGTTSRGRTMWLRIDSQGTVLNRFSIGDSVNLCGTTLVHLVPSPITNGRFKSEQRNLKFEGQFTSATTASGTYAFIDFPSYGPFGQPCTFSVTGTWQAMFTRTLP